MTARSLKLNSFRHSRVSGTYSTHDRILDLVLAAGNRNSRRHSKSLASPRSIRTSFSFSQGALNSLVNDGKSFLLTRMINSHFTPSVGRLLISTRLSITLKKQTHTQYIPDHPNGDSNKLLISRTWATRGPERGHDKDQTFETTSHLKTLIAIITPHDNVLFQRVWSSVPALSLFLSLSFLV